MIGGDGASVDGDSSRRGSLLHAASPTPHAPAPTRPRSSFNCAPLSVPTTRFQGMHSPNASLLHSPHFGASISPGLTPTAQLDRSESCASSRDQRRASLAFSGALQTDSSLTSPSRRSSVMFSPTFSGAVSPASPVAAFPFRSTHAAAATRATSEPSSFLPPIAGATARSVSSPCLQPQPHPIAVPHFNLDEDSGVFALTARRSPSRLPTPQTSSSPSSSLSPPAPFEPEAQQPVCFGTPHPLTKPALPKALAPLAMHSRRLFNNVTATITDMAEAEAPYPPRSPTAGSMLLRTRRLVDPAASANASPSPSSPSSSSTPPRFSPLPPGEAISCASLTEATPLVAAKLAESLESLRRLPIQAAANATAPAPLLPSDPLSLLSPRCAIVPIIPPQAAQPSADFDLHVEDSGTRPRRWKHPSRRRSFSDSEDSDLDDEPRPHPETLEDIDPTGATGLQAPLTPLIAVLDAIPHSSSQQPQTGSTPKSSPSRRKRRDTGSMAMTSRLAEHVLSAKREAAAPSVVVGEAASVAATSVPPSPLHAHSHLIASSLPAHMKMSVARQMSASSSGTTSSVGSSVSSSVSVSRQLSVDPYSSPSSTVSSLGARGELDTARSSLIHSAHGLLSFSGHWDSPSAPRRSTAVGAPSSPASSTFARFSPATRAKSYSPAVANQP